jgi:sulfite reductase (NADPH) hemoprotein beta-component
MISQLPAIKPPNPNEGIKLASNHLRGTIAKDLVDASNGTICEINGQLTKFHGLYMQDDRDLRNELKQAGKEKAFAFMLRLRLPGGRVTP